MPTIDRKGQASTLSNDDIDKILSLSSMTYRGPFAIAAFTGCRISEALSLDAKFLDLKRGSITFTKTKTGHDRVVSLDPELIEILGALNLPTHGYLFPSPKTAGSLTRQGAGKELKAICEDLGLMGVSTHSFRRSLATVLHSNGAPLKSIAAITGHRSLDSLQRYIDVTPDDQRAALALRRQ